MENSLGIILLTVILIIIGIAIFWWLLSKLYQRSTTELAFVRTGFLGEKVAISGGAFVFPVVHDVTRVNMNTLRLGVSHFDKSALITQDRLRINIEADFYVRVRPERAAVAAAARTMGSRTLSADAMRQLLEARFTDALRTAAAEQPMEALHENRGAYAQRVRELATIGLEASGLEIDSVSISTLDQASREFFNPNNAFDAAGLTKLTAEIEERRKKRNEIERDAQVAIQRKNLTAEQQLLELQREEEYARMQQEHEISVRRAEQQSRIAAEVASLKRESQVAEVNAAESIEKARIASDKTLREQKILLEQQLKTMEIERSRNLELAETERRKTLELAQQAIEIEIAENSRKRNAALAQAETSRAASVRAEEAVLSAREIERAEREKALALIAAQREVEAGGLAITEKAQAEKVAAEHRANTTRLLAEAQAYADQLQREGKDKNYAIEAKGRRALNEAENLMSADAMKLRVQLAAIEQVQNVMRESAKPLEHISEIKILHVDGLNNGSGSGTDDLSGSQSVSDQVMSSALKYKLQAPLLDTLMQQAGMHSEDLTRPLKASLQRYPADDSRSSSGASPVKG
ncbi:flotillin family protein [Neopusillimonas aromaticivorans]|uniref:flotillin family protein n=1 Tax=Neopusillimonas aromaticivorans TaxID=2979868 RepID=UPI002594D8F7|nr:flotillin domain-containing protein [Neopusillimonas aromaticivorans]WJJ92533.1 flotillin domain-containing protein [Neopusillimonas aromaticivorans]